MNLTGDQLLARARLPAHEDVQRRRRGTLDQAEQFPHRPAHADERAQGRLPLQRVLQAAGALLQFDPPGVSTGDGANPLHLERLGDVIGRAQPHALDGAGHAIVGRDHDDLSATAFARQFAQHRQPIHARHVQVEINKVRRLAANHLQRGPAIGGFKQPALDLRQRLGHAKARGRLVIGNENAQRHGRYRNETMVSHAFILRKAISR